MAHRSCPFICINADFAAANKHSPAYAILQAGYFDTVTAAGGLPVILPPVGKAAELDPLLDRLDGIILSGGQDLDPCRRRQATHSSVRPMAARREESDQWLTMAVI